MFDCVSLPLWLLQRYTRALYLCGCLGDKISEADLRPLLARIDTAKPH
jgi:hypothetical protein